MRVRMRAGINGPNIYVVPRWAGHSNLFTRRLTMDKYIGFDIDDKKTVACDDPSSQEDSEYYHGG